MREILTQEFFKSQTYSAGITADEYLATSEGKADVENHLINRVINFRNTIVPWLSSIKNLGASKILEIGCGTGCSTLALAEQGAMVTGIDIDEASIRVAKHRANLYGVKYAIFQENATQIDRFGSHHFDFIIFFASLEHMTIDERIVALKKAWSMLQNGGILVIIETPNRLWFCDEHTALLPFFHWLPDRLAFYYSSMSSRSNFYRFSADIGNPIPESFHRLGRGASYHEFEISIGKDAMSNVAGDLEAYLSKRAINPFKAFKKTFSKENRFHTLIKQMAPDIHPSFFHQDLNLAIMKK